MNNKIEFGREICDDWKDAIEKEWLVWNGRGGYASSTIIGLNTRRYHGLLLAPINPPWDRNLFLSKVEEKVEFKDQEFELSANKYPGTVYPHGHKNMEKFELGPFPTFYYSLPEFYLKKQIFMPHGYNAVVLKYEVQNDRDYEVNLRIFPLINYRKAGNLGKMDFFRDDFKQHAKKKDVKLFRSGESEPFIWMGSDMMSYTESDLSEEDRWYQDMVYLKERERGYESREDHYNPGFFEIPIERGENTFHFLATAGADLKDDFEKIYSKKPSSFENERKSTLVRLQSIVEDAPLSKSGESDSAWEHIIRASDSFIAENDYIITGYHWFSTWGRDTLISLPGLTLVLGRYELAKRILSSTLDKMEGGIVPNRFWKSEVEFNSSDASLLFFNALFKYLLYTDDLKFIQESWQYLKEIIQRYSSSEGERVRMDNTGLIWVDEGTTWMDARVDGRCVTPREGKPVDVNALWYNALKIMETIGEKIGKNPKFEIEAEDVKKRFVEKFWYRDKGYLYDLLHAEGPDNSLRPNQILALSLPFPLLDSEKAKELLNKVREELETPFGLRSLSKESPEYRGSYEGDIRSKDLAYHQGTVWGWLMGPYITSLCRFCDEEGREHARELLESFVKGHLNEAGIGTMSEVFDGDEPHNPGGCISQAWTVGEVLRSYCEDVKEIRPPFEDEYLGGEISGS